MYVSLLFNLFAFPLRYIARWCLLFEIDYLWISEEEFKSSTYHCLSPVFEEGYSGIHYYLVSQDHSVINIVLEATLW